MPFTKMHGLGNDFILVEEDQLPLDIDLPDLAQRLCNRHFGIGADGLIIVSPPTTADFQIQMKIYNADGSVAEMCGNGLRCFARYVKDQGLVTQPAFVVETLAGPIKPKINANLMVTVDMGKPILKPADVPVRLPHRDGKTDTDPVLNEALHINDELTVFISAVSMGNPHCIIFDQPNQPAGSWMANWKQLGPIIETHQAFPAKTNVHFCRIVNRNLVEVNVWERGAGTTLACGTGACAIAVAGQLNGWLDETVTIKLPGGPLDITWNGLTNPSSQVVMTGPAAYVFAGMFPIGQAAETPMAEAL
ncbi:MAG: diaminopimelate epimerase [Cyanobacteria bacterium HKST-UBA06]|nr:diaminopimelate epimerase [Cyanobacteria bacterium HKST-UBA06]